MSDASPHFVLDGLAGWRAAWLGGTALSADGETLGLQPLPRSGAPAGGRFGEFRRSCKWRSEWPWIAKTASIFLTVTTAL